MPKGSTFLDEPASDRRHLRIIITDADIEQNFLTVPLCTYKEGLRGVDNSCVLQVGDHPFIKHDSFVDYRHAEVFSFAKIFNGLQMELFIRKEDISPEVLKKIQNGAKKTKYIKTEYKRFFSFF